MLIAVLKNKFVVLFIIIFDTLSFPNEDILLPQSISSTIKCASAYGLSNSNKMAMVNEDGSCVYFGGLAAQVDWLCLRVGGHPVLSLHSSNEPAELSQ